MMATNEPEDLVMLALVKFELEAKSNVYAREVWNAAIEKAAQIGEQDHGSYCEETGNEIRKLKV